MFRLHIRRVIMQVLAECCFVPLLAGVAPADITAEKQLAGFTVKQFHELQNKARHGDPTAALALGLAYEEGIHVEKDEAEAVKWYRRAGEAGSAEAQHHLGVL
jgi:TPR repeat protein